MSELERPGRRGEGGGRRFRRRGLTSMNNAYLRFSVNATRLGSGKRTWGSFWFHFHFFNRLRRGGTELM